MFLRVLYFYLIFISLELNSINVGFWKFVRVGNFWSCGMFEGKFIGNGREMDRLVDGVSIELEE